MLQKKIKIYDEIYIGASLAVLLKICTSNKKILIVEKDKNFGGAWRNNYSHNLRNIDLACHLIVTQGKKHCNHIISYTKKLGVKLKVIEKKNLFYDSKNFKAYGKTGPALVCKTGWSDMLNKIQNIILKKKNITIVRNARVSKIEAKEKKIKINYGNKKVSLGKKIYFPVYCDLNHINFLDKKIHLPFNLIKNIHYVFFLKAKSNILNNEFQAFLEKNKNSIFDRLSISSSTYLKNKVNSYVVCARVSKNIKTKLHLINYKSILSFLMSNKLIDSGKVILLKRIKYICPYRNIDDVKKIKDLLKINKIPVEILDTRYMGHFLWKIAKLHYKKNVIK